MCALFVVYVSRLNASVVAQRVSDAREREGQAGQWEKGQDKYFQAREGKHVSGQEKGDISGQGNWKGKGKGEGKGMARERHISGQGKAYFRARERQWKGIFPGRATIFLLFFNIFQARKRERQAGQKGKGKRKRGKRGNGIARLAHPNL